MKIRFFPAGATKNLIFFFLTLIIFLIFLVLISEAALRIYFLTQNFFYPPDRRFEKYLGWESKANDKWISNVPGYGEITYSTGPYGFRVFGDNKTNKKKVLVIGDSFTQAESVSDGEAYFDYIKAQKMNSEFFVYGCGGYSSLQEYLILDRYFDLIKPDLIIWQFCHNDWVNNNHELESGRRADNLQMTRPYLENGHIVWLFPAHLKGWSYQLSRNFLLIRFIKSCGDLFLKLPVNEETKLNFNSRLGHNSVEITRKIFNLVRKRAGNIPIVAFGYEQVFPEICRENRIYYIPGVFPAVENEKRKGKKVDGAPFDGHPNNAGHQIMGKVILEYLEKNKLL